MTYGRATGTRLPSATSVNALSAGSTSKARRCALVNPGCTACCAVPSPGCRLPEKSLGLNVRPSCESSENAERVNDAGWLPRFVTRISITTTRPCGKVGATFENCSSGPALVISTRHVGVAVLVGGDAVGFEVVAGALEQPVMRRLKSRKYLTPPILPPDLRITTPRVHYGC